MAVLQKIRVKFGVVISVIIALALLSFIIDPSTLETALNSMSSKYDVGKIAGKSVSYTDFLADVDRYTTINEIVTGSSVQNEQTQTQIRNAAWQELLDKFMFVENAKKAGLTVGEDELADLLSGDNISPVIAQNPAFAGQDGTFSRDALMQFIQSIESDESGRLKIYWNYLQNTVRTQEFYAKYGSLFTASNFLNKLMIDDDLAMNNTTASIDYVPVYYSYAIDSTINVSSSEIRAYYKNHKDFFKQKASRDAEYVVFEVIPSAEDIAAANDELTAVYDEFCTTDNMKNFLSRNSDRSLSSYWYKEGELASVSKTVSDFVDGASAGAVSPVLVDGNTFYAVKVMDQQKRPAEISVRVISAADAASVEDVLTDLRLAEPMRMTQTYLIPGCEPLFGAKLNTPQLIQTVQYGQIAAEVVEASEPVVMKQVAILEKDALASKETFNKYYSQANTFATLAGSSLEGYKKAVDSLGVYSHPMNKMTEATSSFGAIDQAKEVTRWIFDAKKGQASNIITVNNNYFFIAAVKDIYKEGYSDIRDVASVIRDRLYTQKRNEKTVAQTAEKIAGMTSLEEIAEALGSTVVNKPDMAFSSRSASAVEPVIAGAAANAQIGAIAGPVAGDMAAYIIRVNSREAGSFYTEDDAKNTALSKAQYAAQMIIPAMMEEADVVDNRARFF